MDYLRKIIITNMTENDSCHIEPMDQKSRFKLHKLNLSKKDKVGLARRSPFLNVNNWIIIKQKEKPSSAKKLLWAKSG